MLRRRCSPRGPTGRAGPWPSPPTPTAAGRHRGSAGTGSAAFGNRSSAGAGTPDGRSRPDFVVELGSHRAGAGRLTFSRTPAGNTAGRSAADLHLPGGTNHSLSLGPPGAGPLPGGVCQASAGRITASNSTCRPARTLGPLGYTPCRPRTRQEKYRSPEPNLVLLETPGPHHRRESEPRPRQRRARPSVRPKPGPLLPYLLPLAVGLYLLELVIRRLAEEPAEHAGLGLEQTSAQTPRVAGSRAVPARVAGDIGQAGSGQVVP